MVGARPAEREQMPARLQYAQRLPPDLDIVGDARCVPPLSHEAELVGRIGDDGVNAGVGQLSHALAAVADEDAGAGHTFLHAA